MTTAEYVLGVFAELQEIIPVLRGRSIHLAYDDPSNAFAIARYYGLDPDGDLVMSFDDGRLPDRRTVVHEIFHGVDDLTDDGGFLAGGATRRAFWTARGLPGTPEASDAIAADLQAEWVMAGAQPGDPRQFRSWQHWSAEIFAECGAACFVDGWNEIAQTYGVPLDRERMRAFFQNLGREDMDDAEFERRWLAVYAKIEVAKTFDDLKFVDAILTERLDAIEQRHMKHSHDTSIPKPL